MTVGAAIAGRLLAKATPWLVGLVLALGLALYVQWLRSSVDAAQIAVGQAEGQLTQARTALGIMEAKARADVAAITMQAAGDRARAETLARDMEKIRNAKRPIPAVCRDALRPLDELARQLQALSRDARTSDPAPPGGRVHGPADSPEIRGSR